jgi:hypothetical protein
MLFFFTLLLLFLLPVYHLNACLWYLTARGGAESVKTTAKKCSSNTYLFFTGMLIQEEDFQAASDYDILHYLYCHTERSVSSALKYSILGGV